MPPPARTACFSRTRKPGVVLRVQTIRALCGFAAATRRAVAVAIPDRRQAKLSATRSADRIPRAGPAMRATTSPFPMGVPSGFSTQRQGHRRRRADDRGFGAVDGPRSGGVTTMAQGKRIKKTYEGIDPVQAYEAAAAVK